MESSWSDEDAKAAVERWGTQRGSNEDVALRTYASRLIGRDPTLVLHGGGNTSVKTRLNDDTGESVDVLCVKGSGWDLGDIEPAGHPAVRLGTLQALRKLDALSDEDMVNAARTRLLDASSPNPSVETLLHAFLPHKFIDHSHADAILAVADQPESKAIAREVFGDTLAIVEYVMPGFALAKLAAEVYEAHPDCEGLLLLQHGLFTFGATARESYERHVRAVDKAEAFARSKRPGPSSAVRPDADWASLAAIVRGRLGAGEKRFVLRRRSSPAIRRFVDDPKLATFARRGPATPDHVIRTKQKPLILDPSVGAQAWPQHVESALAEYRGEYVAYFAKQLEAKGVDKTQLDPHPRVLLIPGVGIVTAGADQKAADVAGDIWEHTAEIIASAEGIGRYQALGDDHIFDMEYWSLEQAKLGKKKPKLMAGHVVYVTGAGSGIGAATARAFASAGAQVYLADVDEEKVRAVASELGAPHDALDVRSRGAIEASIDRAVETFGGIDGVVSNAGTAPQAPIHDCPPEVFEGSLAVNLTSHQWVAGAAARVMRAQGTGGYLLFNASKAAFNPGKNFGPYAVAKAGVVALMKQHALEGGDAGIRANAINADRIRTGLLPEEVVDKRARARGLDADAYFRSNLLQQEVTAADVAAAFVYLAQARSTTGAVLTVDGGNIAASPR